MTDTVGANWLTFGKLKYLPTEATESHEHADGMALVFSNTRIQKSDSNSNVSSFVTHANKPQLHAGPVGGKNLYFMFLEGFWYLSNKIKPLSALRRNTTISKQALFHYFFFHCIPAPHTIYEGINKIEAGTCTRLKDDGTWTSEIDYNPTFATSMQKNEDELHKIGLELIDKCVGDAITENCGAFLSGGLDSSTVAGMLAQHKQPAKTFSIGFTSKEHDETEYAKITAKQFDLEHRVKILKAEEAVDAFTLVAQAFDEPFGNSSAMAAYYCAKFAKENGIDHLLAGDGGDEIFAGNERYAKQKVFEYYTNQPRFIRVVADMLFNNPISAKLPGLKKAASYIRQAKTPMPDRLENYNFIHQFGAENIFTKEFLTGIDQTLPIAMRRERYNACSSDDQVDKQLFLDWKFTLADNDLVKVGTMCELAGIDVSFPLLDKRLIDFSCQIPAKVKLPGNALRDFYKRMCSGFLADETLNKSKHGFGLPFGVWLKENEALGKIAMDALEHLKQRNIVKASLIEQAQKAHSQIHANYYGELIWIMVVLELWLQGHED